MSKNYRNYKRKSNRNTSIEAALRHIQDANEFSHEIGGYDEDVKKYFFDLKKEELNVILNEYGSKFGEKAEIYARDTIDNWKTKKTKMSGLVAKRLFNLLPPRMPLSKKFELAENIWLHFGPSSQHSYCIGKNSDIIDVIDTISNKLDEYVNSYNVPNNIKNRFNWLSDGDIEKQTELLNYFRNFQKKIVSEKLNLEIPLLQKQLIDNTKTTHHLMSEIIIQKHTIKVYIDRELDDQIIEGNPKIKDESSYTWLIILAIIVISLFMLKK